MLSLFPSAFSGSGCKIFVNPFPTVFLFLETPLPGLLKEQYQKLRDRPAPPNVVSKGPINLYNTNTAPVVPPPKRYRPPRSIPVQFEVQPPQEKRKRKRTGTPPLLECLNNHGNG
mmetsp:Transcript_89831/g.155619  ORF Transcript_89831/g.155619 Transcript_89831/m.155619 type:complete len:115 (-) Transcript_89831:254-598(-)